MTKTYTKEKEIINSINRGYRKAMEYNQQVKEKKAKSYIICPVCAGEGKIVLKDKTKIYYEK